MPDSGRAVFSGGTSTDFAPIPHTTPQPVAKPGVVVTNIEEVDPKDMPSSWSALKAQGGGSSLTYYNKDGTYEIHTIDNTLDMVHVQKYTKSGTLIDNTEYVTGYIPNYDDELV